MKATWPSKLFPWSGRRGRDEQAWPPSGNVRLPPGLWPSGDLHAPWVTSGRSLPSLRAPPLFLIRFIPSPPAAFGSLEQRSGRVGKPCWSLDVNRRKPKGVGVWRPWWAGWPPGMGGLVMRGGLCHCRHSCQIQGTCPEPLHPCSLYPDSACLQMWLLGAELPSGSWWYMLSRFSCV